MTDIEREIFEYLKETYEIGDDPDFTVDVNIFDSGFVDSLDALEILDFLDSNFNVEITQRDLTLYPMNSVKEMAIVIEKKLS